MQFWKHIPTCSYKLWKQGTHIAPENSEFFIRSFQKKGKTRMVIHQCKIFKYLKHLNCFKTIVLRFEDIWFARSYFLLRTTNTYRFHDINLSTKHAIVLLTISLLVKVLSLFLYRNSYIKILNSSE